MSTISHEPSVAVPERRRWPTALRVREMWAALAIVAMWLAVLFDAVFGPDIVSVNGAGTQSTTVPSAVVVALFAWLATRVVAKYGFGRQGEDAD